MRCVDLDGRRQLPRVPPTSSPVVRPLSVAQGEAWNLASQRPGFFPQVPCLEIVDMIGKHKLGKHKSSGNIPRAGRSKPNLGQKEAKLEKAQAELEKVSEAQFSHMEGGKAAKAALKQKAKIESK